MSNNLYDMFGRYSNRLAAALDDDDDEENEHESSVPPAVGPPPPPLTSSNTETVMEDRFQGTVERNNEMKAIELRATLPLEERQEMFKAMLLERGVSFVISNSLIIESKNLTLVHYQSYISIRLIFVKIFSLLKNILIFIQYDFVPLLSTGFGFFYMGERAA